MRRMTYYAVVSGGRPQGDPAGLARRIDDEAGLTDEALRRDMTWGPTSAIAEWERDAMDIDLIEVTEAEAQRLAGVLRERWAGPA
jgi:hypothetical protein